ncbi:MAG TPA: hypothetical protein VLC12_03760 [Terriglobales bacterium]|nr:hypothetical protein [Terriglobales bacterium]
MLTKEHTRAEHAHKDTLEFHEPTAWLGRTPKKLVKICFAATNVEDWDTGAEAVVTCGGKKFRIVCEGKDVPLAQTTRGILVGE